MALHIVHIEVVAQPYLVPVLVPVVLIDRTVLSKLGLAVAGIHQTPPGSRKAVCMATTQRHENTPRVFFLARSRPGVIYMKSVWKPICDIRLPQEP